MTMKREIWRERSRVMFVWSACYTLVYSVTLALCMHWFVGLVLGVFLLIPSMHMAGHFLCRLGKHDDNETVIRYWRSVGGLFAYQALFVLAVEFVIPETLARSHSLVAAQWALLCLNLLLWYLKTAPAHQRTREQVGSWAQEMTPA